MPAVLRADGFRVSILLPPREHAPAHVHVFKAGGEVVIELFDDGSASVREIRGMSTPNVRDALALVDANIGFLRTEWRKIHGED